MKTTLYGLLILSLILLANCAQKKVQRQPSNYLLSTKRSTTRLISDLKSTLETKKYKIRSSDKTLGILTTQSRCFTVNGDNGKVRACHTLQIRQEGGSVKVRIPYNCKYEGKFEVCHQDDQAVEEKVSRFEPKLIRLIKKILAKKDKATFKSQVLEGLADPQE